jgi:hypothetical protein
MRLTVRVLPVLQLTRMALVFTAIADSVCALLLQAQAEGGGVPPERLGAVVLMSVGLYGFGMALNDIIDRRRDALIAGHRPLPSGRIGVGTAHVIAGALAAMALVGGALYSGLSPAAGWRSFILVAWVGTLISFYDVAGKYLVAPGLLSLGLIRFFHAAAPGPGLPVVWHALVLLNHVTILSAVAYQWEEKRPALTRGHWAFVLGGLAAVDALVIAAVYARRAADGASFGQVMAVTPGLLLPAAAAVGFVLVAAWVKRSAATSREAGQGVMLYGLLWLIVYDAAFVAGYVGTLPALAVAALLPVAYLGVRVMRAWSKLGAIAQQPEFKKA